MPLDITQQLPTRDILYAGKAWKTGVPVWFGYREKRLWPSTAIDPEGSWVLVAEKGASVDGWLRLRNPLVLDWGSWHGVNSWVERLRKAFKQQKGATLTRNLHRLRYDGIVTIRWDKPYQVVQLISEEESWLLSFPNVSQYIAQCQNQWLPAIQKAIEDKITIKQLLTAPAVRTLFSQYLSSHDLQGTHTEVWSAWEQSILSPTAQKLCALLSSWDVSGKALSLETKREGWESERTLQRLVEAQYSFLQTLLSTQSEKFVRVYRATFGHSLKSQWLTVRTREASVWSLYLNEALQHGTQILSALVPVSRLLAAPCTQRGTWPSSAVIVLGSSSLSNVRVEDTAVKQVGRQFVQLDMNDELWMPFREQMVQRLVSTQHVASRQVQAEAGMLWARVVKELQMADTDLRTVQKWRNLKTPQQIEEGVSVGILQDLAAGKVFRVQSPGAFAQWASKNWGDSWYTSGTDLAFYEESIQDALRIPGEPLTAGYYIEKRYSKRSPWTDDSLRGWTPGPLVDAMEAYRDHLNDILSEVAPLWLSHVGFKIYNPDRVTKSLLAGVLQGLEHLTALFKKRGVLDFLRDSLKEVLVRFQNSEPDNLVFSEGLAHGWYHADKKRITVNADAVAKSPARQLQDWFTEVLVHEMAHHVETLLHPAAWAEWKSGWSEVESRKEKQKVRTKVSPEERRRFFKLFESNNWDPQKVVRKLKGLDKVKYITLLYKTYYGDRVGVLTSVPSQVRLTDEGKRMVRFFRNPREEILKGYPVKLMLANGDTEESIEVLVLDDIQKTTDMYLRYLGVESTQLGVPGPSLDEKVLAEFAEEDTSVAEAIEALGTPTDYARTNPQEDFAETFVAYMGNPGALSARAKYRLQRTLWLSGFYGKPIVERVAKRNLL